jgi:hypothetical protein
MGDAAAAARQKRFDKIFDHLKVQKMNRPKYDDDDAARIANAIIEGTAQRGRGERIYRKKAKVKKTSTKKKNRR